MSSAKFIASRLIDQWPESASWEDILYALCMQQVIEEGLRDGEQSVQRVLTQDQIRRRPPGRWRA